MFRDDTGSDVDYYDRLNPQNPGHEFCKHNVDLDEAFCWRCKVERDERARELSASDVLSAALVVMLDKIREHEDETKGAALAARFEKGSA